MEIHTEFYNIDIEYGNIFAQQSSAKMCRDGWVVNTTLFLRYLIKKIIYKIQLKNMIPVNVSHTTSNLSYYIIIIEI